MTTLPVHKTVTFPVFRNALKMQLCLVYVIVQKLVFISAYPLVAK